jgi:hypothetical protein
MQVKAIPAPGAVAPAVRSLLADDEDVRSLTAWQGGPEVMVTVPVSLELLQAACWADMTEDAGSVRDMTDDTVRSWAVSQLLTHGVRGLDVLRSEIAAQPPTPEVTAYWAAIQERLPLAIESAQAVPDGTASASTEVAGSGHQAAGAAADAYDEADDYADAVGW